MAIRHNLYLDEIYGMAGNEASTFPEGAALAYGKLLLAVCGADGLGPKEKEFFDARNDVAGNSQEIRDELEKFDYANADVPKIVSAFNAALKDTAYGEGMARGLLYDAIRISWKDHVYSAPERAALRKVAQEIGVAEATVNALENLVEVEIAVRRMRLSLLWTVAPSNPIP